MAGDLVDLALMEPAPDHADFLVQKWLDDELLLVCVPGHTLWDTDLLPVAELSRLHYVLREPKTVIRILVDKALQDIGIPHIQVAMELNSTKTIMAMLDQGKHVHFLPVSRRRRRWRNNVSSISRSRGCASNATCGSPAAAHN